MNSPSNVTKIMKRDMKKSLKNDCKERVTLSMFSCYHVAKVDFQGIKVKDDLDRLTSNAIKKIVSFERKRANIVTSQLDGYVLHFALKDERSLLVFLACGVKDEDQSQLLFLTSNVCQAVDSCWEVLKRDEGKPVTSEPDHVEKGNPAVISATVESDSIAGLLEKLRGSKSLDVSHALKQLGLRISEIASEERNTLDKLLVTFFHSKIDHSIYLDALNLVPLLIPLGDQLETLVAGILEAFYKKDSDILKMRSEVIILCLNIAERSASSSKILNASLLEFADRAEENTALIHCFYVLINLRRIDELKEILNRRMKLTKLKQFTSKLIEKVRKNSELVPSAASTSHAHDAFCVSVIVRLEGMFPQLREYCAASEIDKS